MKCVINILALIRCFQYLKKGTHLILEGGIKQTRYSCKHREDGKNCNGIAIVARTIHILSRKKDGTSLETKLPDTDEIPEISSEVFSDEMGSLEVGESDLITRETIYIDELDGET